MTADMQCRAPYSLCKATTNIDIAACSKAGQFMNGFFIGNIKAYRKYFSKDTGCGDAPGGQGTVLWGGCGRAATTISCQGFTAAMECSQSGSSVFQCAGKEIGDVINNDGASGVLCCSPLP